MTTAPDLYEDVDHVIERNRLGRWAMLLGTAAGIPFAVGLGINLTINKLIDFSGDTSLSWLIGAAIGTEIFARISPKFWVIIPQVQFFVTLNPIKSTFFFKGDPNVIYGPGGDGPAFPWERRSEASNGSLEVITINWEEDVPGLDTLLKVKGSYQFKVDLKIANKFVGIDESTIKGGIIDLIKAEVSTKLSSLDADSAKQRIGILNEDLSKKFGLEAGSTAEKTVNAFESRYGIQTIAVTISGIDLPVAVQKTRDAIDEAKQALKGVAELYGRTTEQLKIDILSGKISPEQYNNMLDRFAAFSDNATMEIKAYKIDSAAEIAKIFAEAFAARGKS